MPPTVCKVNLRNLVSGKNSSLVYAGEGKFSPAPSSTRRNGGDGFHSLRRGTIPSERIKAVLPSNDSRGTSRRACINPWSSIPALPRRAKRRHHARGCDDLDVLTGRMRYGASPKRRQRELEFSEIGSANPCSHSIRPHAGIVSEHRFKQRRPAVICQRSHNSGHVFRKAAAAKTASIYDASVRLTNALI